MSVESIIQWLQTPHATLLFALVGLAFLVVEFLTRPVWSWVGTVGVLFLGAVFVAHLFSGSHWWGMLVFALGVALVIVETHVLPGRGISALLGFLCIFAGMREAIMIQSHPLFALVVSSILTLMSMVVFFLYLPKCPLWREMQHRMQLSLSFNPQVQRELLGAEGVTITDLTPGGLAQFGGVSIHVLTEQEFLPARTPVRVADVRPDGVVVEPLSKPSHSEVEKG
ncbi:MAG: NfeD family protein [Armatimonadota bacterium]|nr:NfeD family protein [Armatimonadota bacterium]